MRLPRPAFARFALLLLLGARPLAAAERRRAPVVATITGSSTTFFARWRCNPAATARMRRESTSAPIFTAAGRKSVKTASICLPMIEGERVSTPVIRRVFCAVAATRTVAPWTPCAAKVSRSA